MILPYAFGVLVVVVFIRMTVSRLLRARKERNHGCKAAKRYPHKDPIFGLDLVFQDQQAHKRGQHLHAVQDRFRRCGKTFEQLMPDRTRVIHTMEPKNAQTVAIQVQDFGFAPMRYEFPPTREFFSRGILTVDGPFWEHSRALIKPIFTKAQIANLESLDAHLAKMITYIPRDRSTIDLQPLLKRLVGKYLLLLLISRALLILSPEKLVP